MKKYITIFLLACIPFWSCQNNSKELESEASHSHEADEHSHDDEAEGVTEEVELTKVQIEKIGLKYGRIELRNLSSTIKLNGVLEIPPQNKASVSSLISGKIWKVYVKPGQFIKKGGLLAMVQNPDLIDMQKDLMETEGELLFLEKEYVRQKELVEKEVAAKKQFEKIESELAIARAHKKAMESKLGVLQLPNERGQNDFSSMASIRSPISGFIKEIGVNTGSFVETNKTLFEVVDNHHIHLDLKVFEKDLPFMKIGQKIDFWQQSFPGKIMQAEIFAIGKALSEDDRTATVHAEITNSDESLLPGMYIEARVITTDAKQASLPESAIINDKGLDFIFVKEEEHEEEVHFKKVQVLVTERDMGFAGVDLLEQFDQNEGIVVEGAYFLMAESKKGEGGGGHHH